MATYGRGQMLGSGVNPESFKQDYSGFARAAETQAQGMANLGASIGGVIKDFGEAKKEQKKVDANNKASAKAIEAAITLGKSYKITGAEKTLRPFLNAYNNPSLSPIEKAALLDEGKGMIPNVFGRFDASQANAIQMAQLNARNAPPMPEPLTFKREEPIPYKGGFLNNLQRGSDGQLYDENLNLIVDQDAYARGERPEVYSGGSSFTDDFGSMITPEVSFPETNVQVAPSVPSLPTNLNVDRPFSMLDPEQIDLALGAGSVLPSREGTPDVDLAQSIAALEAELGIDANKRKELKSRLFTEAKPEVAERAMTDAERIAANLPAGEYMARFTGNKPSNIKQLTTPPDSLERLKENRMLKADDRISAVIESTDKGGERLINMNEALSLLNSGEVKSGSFGAYKLKAARLFGMDVASEEQFNSLVGNLALEAIDLTKGAISDREMTFFREELAPGINKSVDGNKRIIQFKIAAAKRGLRINQVAREMLANNALPADIEAEIKKIQKEDSLVPSDTTDQFTPKKPQSATDRLRGLR